MSLYLVLSKSKTYRIVDMNYFLIIFAFTFMFLSQTFAHFCEDKTYQDMAKKKYLTKDDHYKLIKNEPNYNFLMRVLYEDCLQTENLKTLKSNTFSTLCPNLKSTKRRLPCVKEFISSFIVDSVVGISHNVALLTLAGAKDKENFPAEKTAITLQLLDLTLNVFESFKFSQFYAMQIKGGSQAVEKERSNLKMTKTKLLGRLEEIVNKFGSTYKDMTDSEQVTLSNIKSRIKIVKEKDWMK